MKVSAFIITLNEEANLARCLESLDGLADEMVVVDSGSADRTRSIAGALGARVIERPWDGFVGQKNFALAQCRHEWAFSIDADEEVSPELRSELKELLPRLKEGTAQDIWAYAVPRLVRYRGKWIRHGDWYPDYVTRLVYKSKARFSGGQVHERLEHPGRTRRLKHPLYHYTYQDEADHLERLRKYSTLWAQSKFAEGKRASRLAPYWRAGFRFGRALLLKQGFLDGPLGCRIAALCSYEVYLKYKKLHELSRS